MGRISFNVADFRSVQEDLNAMQQFGQHYMTHQVAVTFDRSIIYSGVGHFWRRFIGWQGFALILFCVVGSVALFLRGDRSWSVGALGVTGLFLITTSTSVYVVFLRRSLSKFKRMSSKSTTFTFSEESFSLVSDLGSANLSWQAIEKVWRFPDIWLLFLAKTTYVILPVAQIDQAIQVFLVDQITRHGGQAK